MVVEIQIYVDGGCRGNGYSNAIGAAAAVVKFPDGQQATYNKTVIPDPRVTNQRAELQAIILALEVADQSYDERQTSEYKEFAIFSDSQYAINCMTRWLHNWLRNGWVNSSGGVVVNRDLIESALVLEDRIMEVANVTYRWIPREQNREADAAVNRAMDVQARQY